MPYRVQKQSCTRSDGKKGKYVLKYKPKSPTKKKKDSQGFVKAGCHTSKKKADGQRAAIEASSYVRPGQVIKELRRLIRSIIKESIKDLHTDLQNEILELGRKYGGEIVVQDVVDYLVDYANDPMGDPRAGYVGSIDYDEALQILFDMKAAGMLTGGYEDFFEIHPDYM